MTALIRSMNWQAIKMGKMVRGVNRQRIYAKGIHSTHTVPQSKKNVINVIRYLDIIEKLYQNKEDELLYSFTLPIREYKKK